MKRSLVSVAAVSVLCLITGGNAELSAQNNSPGHQNADNIVADVFANYFVIQKSLAEDSLANVSSAGQAIARRVSQDSNGDFRPGLIGQAEALAAAPDLVSARQIFKAVSGYLIQARRAGHGPGGVVHEMHSTADNVNWLQQGEVIQNPYQGKACQHCGTFVN